MKTNLIPRNNEMSHKSSLLNAGLLIPAGLLLPIASSLAADVTWNNPAVGAFITDTNWTPNAVPGSGDNAILANGGTAELTTGQAASVLQLRVSNGEMTAADASVTTGITSSSWQTTGDLQVGGPSGTGSLAASGASTISTGRVRIGGYNTSGGGDSENAVGTLSLSGSSTLQTAVGGGYDFWLGNGAGSSGTLNMSGTSQLTVNSSMTSGRAGGNGTLNLSGSSTFTVTTSANIGEGGTANWTISENASASTGGNLVLAGSSSTLTVEDSGALVVGGEFQIGNGGGNVGNVVFSGGTITANSWTSIGRQGGTGSVTMSGNAVLTKAGGGNLIVGDGTTGTMSVSGNASIVSNSDIWVGLNGGGNGTLTISGGSSQTSGSVIVARNDVGAQGTLNLNGGTLTTNAIEEGSGSGTINFNGGTLRAGAASGDFLAGFEDGDLNLQLGGLTFDSNGNAVTITQGLGGVGGLTKIGAGSLTFLSLAMAYEGNTVISGGTLSIHTSFLADSSNVLLSGSGVFDLNFAGTDTIGALYLNGIAQSTGIWGAIGSGADFQSAFFTGDGLLLVTVPEPEHYAVGAIAVLGLAILSRRKRLA